MIALVYSDVEAFPPKSPVIFLPSANVLKIAFSILSAWEFRDMWRSIMIELMASDTDGQGNRRKGGSGRHRGRGRGGTIEEEQLD